MLKKNLVGFSPSSTHLTLERKIAPLPLMLLLTLVVIGRKYLMRRSQILMVK